MHGSPEERGEQCVQALQALLRAEGTARGWEIKRFEPIAGLPWVDPRKGGLPISTTRLDIYLEDPGYRPERLAATQSHINQMVGTIESFLGDEAPRCYGATQRNVVPYAHFGVPMVKVEMFVYPALA